MVRERNITNLRGPKPSQLRCSKATYKEVIHPQVPLRVPCVDLPRLAEPGFEPLSVDLIRTRLEWVDGQ